MSAYKKNKISEHVFTNAKKNDTIQEVNAEGTKWKN